MMGIRFSDKLLGELRTFSSAHPSFRQGCFFFIRVDVDSWKIKIDTSLPSRLPSSSSTTSYSSSSLVSVLKQLLEEETEQQQPRFLFWYYPWNTGFRTRHIGLLFLQIPLSARVRSLMIYASSTNYISRTFNSHLDDDKVVIVHLHSSTPNSNPKRTPFEGSFAVEEFSEKVLREEILAKKAFPDEPVLPEEVAEMERERIEFLGLYLSNRRRDDDGLMEWIRVDKGLIIIKNDVVKETRLAFFRFCVL